MPSIIYTQTPSGQRVNNPVRFNLSDKQIQTVTERLPVTARNGNKKPNYKAPSHHSFINLPRNATFSCYLNYSLSIKRYERKIIQKERIVPKFFKRAFCFRL